MASDEPDLGPTMAAIAEASRRIKEAQANDLLEPGEPVYVTPDEWEWLKANASARRQPLGAPDQLSGRAVIVDAAKASEQRGRMRLRRMARELMEESE